MHNRRNSSPEAPLRAGLLTQWYDPEPGPASLPGILARGLRDRGHQVQVLTGFPNYPTGDVSPGYRVKRKLDEHLDGVDVRRVALYPSHDSSTARRLANYTSFGLSAMASGGNVLRGLDALWVNYSPITVAMPMWLARYGFGVPCVAHVLDLWPDTVLAGGFAHEGLPFRAARASLNAWCGAMYRAAESVAYISPGVGDVLHSRGVEARRLQYVPMWADEHVFHPSNDHLRAELRLRGEQIVCLYAGTLGHAQGLDSLIDACEMVSDDRFVCLIAGSGTAEESLRRRTAERKLSNVRFLGRLPKERMTALMAAGDLHYVGLRSHALSSITMPSKVQATLAAGRALLVAAEGDAASVAIDSGAGFAAHPDRPEEIAERIRAACQIGRHGLARLGEQARRYYEHNFAAELGVRRIEALLENAAECRGRRTHA